MAIVSGPADSPWLGKVLAIDLLGARHKFCSFDCIYCPLGETTHPVVRRRDFIRPDDLRKELEAARSFSVDYIYFAGRGEATLAGNLGGAIEMVKSALHKPVAVPTNGSLLSREDVRQDLAKADVVSVKLDAPDGELFRRINRPRVRIGLREIVECLKFFRNGYRGRLALQIMFLPDNKDCAVALAQVAREINADEVQLNTPSRSGSIKPLSPEDMLAVKQAFAEVRRVVTVYDGR